MSGEGVQPHLRGCVSGFRGWASRSRERWRKDLADDPDGLLVAICAFAALAECVSSMVTPDFTERGTGIKGAFCNLFGSLLCGLVTSLGALGPQWALLASAVKGGFVAAFTSFAGVVENTVDLRCSGNDRDLIYLSSLFVGGPLCFALSAELGDAALGLIGFSAPVSSPEPAKASPRFLRHVGLIVSACVAAMIAWQAQLRGGAEAAELATGVAFTVAACLVGTALSACVEELLPQESVNWCTIGSNSVAVLLIVVCELSGGAFDRGISRLGLGTAAVWAANVAADKYRGCFCACISAYGDFSEDILSGLRRSGVNALAGNLGMNAVSALFTVACMSHLRCGRPLFA